MSTNHKKGLPQDEAVDLVSINGDHELPYWGTTPVMPIPGSGLCWITSFLIGVYLRLMGTEKMTTFREIIGGLGVNQRFVQWILEGTFVSNSFDWDRGNARADEPLHPLIDALKRAILFDADSLETEVASDYNAVVENDWRRQFEQRHTHHGSFFSVRVLQKFFANKGLKTNVVIFADRTVSGFSEAGFKDCLCFDLECPTITTYYTGSHFDLLTDLHSLVIDRYTSPPLPVSPVDEAERRAVDVERRAVDAERRAIEAERRAIDAEKRIANATSHAEEAERRAEEAERVMRQVLDESTKLRNENSKMKTLIEGLQARLKEADESYARTL